MTPEEVIAFWFGELDASGRADELHRKQWFRSDPAFDEEIRRRFLGLHDEIASGRRGEWRTSDRGSSVEPAAGRSACVRSAV